MPEIARAWPEHDPAPETTSLEPRPSDAPNEPLAVRKAAKMLEDAGWEVRIGYARAWKRQPATGTYRPIETFSVQAGPGHPSGWRVMAVHERFMDTGAARTFLENGDEVKTKASGVPGKWSWARVTVFKGITWHVVSITDLKQFASVRGSVLPAWFADIQMREAAKEAKAKQAAKARPKKAGEAL